MALTKQEVLKIAKLARLALTDKEVSKFSTQLTGILDYVAKLQSVDTKGMEPIAQITGLENVVREDVVEVKSDETHESLLDQAPKRKGDLIETLGVFE